MTPRVIAAAIDLTEQQISFQQISFQRAHIKGDSSAFFRRALMGEFRVRKTASLPFKPAQSLTESA
jgi:hypothetical protein